MLYLGLRDKGKDHGSVYLLGDRNEIRERPQTRKAHRAPGWGQAPQRLLAAISSCR